MSVWRTVALICAILVGFIVFIIFLGCCFQTSSGKECLRRVPCLAKFSKVVAPPLRQIAMTLSATADATEREGMEAEKSMQRRAEEARA